MFNALSIVGAVLVSASSTAESASDWKVDWTPYIWASSLDAGVGLGNLPEVESQLGFADLIDKADTAFMHHLEIRKGQWGIVNEIIYLDLSDSSTPGAGVVVDSVDVGVTQGIYDLAASYTPEQLENTSFLLGLRYIDVNLDVRINSNLNGPLAGKHSHGEDWSNLLVGVHQRIPFSDNWTLGLKADYAGDLGDEESYILTAGLDYSIREFMSLKFGYRHAAVDFDSSDFSLDETVAGPYLGLGFHW